VKDQAVRKMIFVQSFAAKVGGVIESVSTGSGSDRIEVRPQNEMRSFVIQRSFSIPSLPLRVLTRSTFAAKTASSDREATDE